MGRTKAFDEADILEKARDLFWKRGYTATSIGDLEKHLGLSRSSLYQTFGGKRELYDRTLAQYQEVNLGRMRAQFKEVSNLCERLIEMFTSAARAEHLDCTNRARGCYVVNATTELAPNCSEALRFVAGNRERFVAIIRDILARAQVQGQLSEQADPEAWANYLFLCYNGLQVVVQTGIERETLVEAVTKAVHALPWTDRASVG